MAREAGQPRVSPEDLPETLQFMRLMWELVHSLDRASKRMSQVHGVTGPQRLALRVIGLFPALSAGQLAHILHVHPSTLTGVLQRLIDQRLVVRTAAAGDKRRAQLRLTARGLRIDRLTTATVEASVTSVLRRTSARDRAAARRVISTLSAQLGKQLE
jgi:DNA-binding MarR family transcriptional regulator